MEVFWSVLERIGEAAYRLGLLKAAQIHLVFHVSQRKPFTNNYNPVFSELPSTPELHTSARVLVKILHRMAAWGDYYVLKARLPESLLSDAESAQVGTSPYPRNN
jgi:hypothetical protein